MKRETINAAKGLLIGVAIGAAMFLVLYVRWNWPIV